MVIIVPEKHKKHLKTWSTYLHVYFFQFVKDTLKSKTWFLALLHACPKMMLVQERHDYPYKRCPFACNVSARLDEVVENLADTKSSIALERYWGKQIIPRDTEKIVWKKISEKKQSQAAVLHEATPRQLQSCLTCTLLTSLLKKIQLQVNA